MNTRKLVSLLLLAGATALLAACNDSDPPQGAASAQGYTTRVAAVVDAQADPERSEPVPVRAVVAASSETAQPVPVVF